jgi:hypothetical protein
MGLAEQDLADRPAQEPGHDAERLLDGGVELVRLTRFRVVEDAGEGAAVPLAESRECVWSPTAEL